MPAAMRVDGCRRMASHRGMPSPADNLVTHYRQQGRGCSAAEAACPDLASVPGDVFRELPRGGDGSSVFLGLRHDGPDVVDLVWIRAAPESGGHGSDVLRELTSAADSFGVTLKAVVLGRDERLARWYERHGFTGKPHAMKRVPIERP